MNVCVCVCVCASHLLTTVDSPSPFFYRFDLHPLSFVFTMSLPVGIKHWDTQHNSPKAEIVLVSGDGIGFRVDAWYFSQKR